MLERPCRGHSQVFVVSQRNHAWDKAIEVPGSAALNKGKAAVERDLHGKFRLGRSAIQ